MIRSALVVLAALAALVSEAQGATPVPVTLSPSVLSVHPEPVWFEWDLDEEEDRIPNPSYAHARPLPAPPAAVACHVRELAQGSGFVRICEVP